MISSHAAEQATASAMLPRWFRVHNARREVGQVFSIDLAPPRGEETPSFLPGQYNMLYVFGVGEVPISISGRLLGSSGNGSSGAPLTHTVAAVGEVTRALCALRPGEIVGLRGPFGRPWPLDQAEGRDVLLVAGGLGLAPLRSALYELLAQRERYHRITLLYGARSPQDILFAREVQEWRGRFDLRVEVTVDHAPQNWRGPVGVVTSLFKRIALEPERTVALVCGPEIMMRAAARELEDLKLPPERIFLSLERNMQCAIGRCGRCQLGPYFVCKDGPVFAYGELAELLRLR